MTKSTERIQALADLIQTVHRLRAPEGCPWDRAQTHQSLRQYLIEEAYEVLDVLDQIGNAESLKDEKIRGAFREELGDLLMQVLLHSEMASEVHAFDFLDVAQDLNDKLIRRHPHVFGENRVDSADAAFQSWEKQKAAEKAAKSRDASVLDGVPKGLPALQKTARIIEKVSKVGFQWSDLRGPLEKLDEELHEFKHEVAELEKAKGTDSEPALREKLSHELGDLLFSLCNIGYLMKLGPEDSLRSTLARFESRFRHVEKRLRESGKTPDQSSLEEMDRYWNEAKRQENR